MIRRFGTAKVAGKQYTLRPGAYAILPRNGALLLTHQGGQFDEYQLPGGGIDDGETAMAALYREVREETGWSIARPRKLGTFRRFTFMPEYDLWAEKICHIFCAYPGRKLSEPIEEDHREAWVDPITATDILANEGDRHFVSQFVSKLL